MVLEPGFKAENGVGVGVCMWVVLVFCAGRFGWLCVCDLGKGGNVFVRQGRC